MRHVTFTAISLVLFLNANLLKAQEASRDQSDAGPNNPPPATATKDVPRNGSVDTRPIVSSQNGYQIGAGDVLQISVWKEPDISVPSIVVRPDGRITIPLLKDIEVVGLTPGQVEKIITDQLANYVTSPNVTVVVTGTNSKKIYIIGAVKKEGPIQYTYRMTIMQALSEAGGLTDYAKRKKIYVLRAENGKQSRIPFNYDAVLNGKERDQTWLLPSDTLVVPH